MMLLGTKRVTALPKQAGMAHLFSTSARVADAAHKVVVVGGGTAGLTVSHQLLRSGKFAQNDIAIVEPSEWHNYQPGWTLVGGGLTSREALRRPTKSLLDPKLQLYADKVTTFAPEQNQVSTQTGEKLTYEQLVVAPGFETTLDSIPGLRQALDDPSSKVASIYTYDSVDQVYSKINKLKQGRAIFTQPASPIKCAGAPQKIMWFATDLWTKAGLYKPHDANSPIQIDFATGLPVMFGVPKYSEVLNQLREERGVGGLFQHNLVAIEDNGSTAVFARPDGEQVRLPFDFLHATPTMAPPAFLKNSSLANEAGYANVNQSTLQHVHYKNVWAIGDASSLPTSKTAAAITGEAPVLVDNLLRALESKAPIADYDGYTSCPLITEYGKVLLAEFKYGGVPKETFANFGLDQGKPQTAFYYLKKDFFPWVYYNNFVKGTWAGPKGWSFGRRSYTTSALNRPRAFSTSTAALRNAPVRRPRDPLDKGEAARFPLATGETFIARTPPTPESSRATVEGADALFESAKESASQQLPPLLRKQHRQARNASNTLSAEQIAQVQQLRAQDPFKNTAGALAKQFGCSPTFISIVAPAPKEVRSARRAETELKRATWGMNKRIAAEERRERRALW